MLTKVTMTMELELDKDQQKRLKAQPDVLLQTAKLQGAEVKVSLQGKEK
jgi:hypothetical protein